MTLGGAELEFARTRYAEAVYRVTIDYSRQHVSERDKLLLNGRKLDVGAVTNVDEANVEIDMLCSEAKV